MNAQSSQEQWRPLLCTCSQSPLFRSSMRLLDHNLLHYKDPPTPVDLVINLSFFLSPPVHTHFPWQPFPLPSQLLSPCLPADACASLLSQLARSPFRWGAVLSLTSALPFKKSQPLKSDIRHLFGPRMSSLTHCRLHS